MSNANVPLLQKITAKKTGITMNGIRILLGMYPFGGHSLQHLAWSMDARAAAEGPVPMRNSDVLFSLLGWRGNSPVDPLQGASPK